MKFRYEQFQGDAMRCDATRSDATRRDAIRCDRCDPMLGEGRENRTKREQKEQKKVCLNVVCNPKKKILKQKLVFLL